MSIHRGDYSLVKMAKHLDVSVSSYYDYFAGRYNVRASKNKQLDKVIKNCFDDCRCLYGSTRLTVELNKQEPLCAILEYVECWYNRNRRHSTLGYLIITEFNQNYKNNLFKNQILTKTLKSTA